MHQNMFPDFDPAKAARGCMLWSAALVFAVLAVCVGVGWLLFYS
jgi:hypothetical protein